METRTYTERSNARRAARAAGIDPNLVIETEDGFALPAPTEADVEIVTNGNDVDPEDSADQMKAAHAEAEAPPDDLVDTPARTEDDSGIPAFLKIPTEKRKTAWARNPPKATPAKSEDTVAKAKPSKPAPTSRKAYKDKTATLLKMLNGKGATVEKLTEALDWLPHTLRARISRLSKAKSKGGEGLKIERTRTDGVTTYRIA